MKTDLKLVNFVASYFYNFKKDPEKDLKSHIKDCVELYEKQLADERRDNPHHHTNRLD